MSKAKLKSAAPEPLVPLGWNAERWIERIEHVIDQCKECNPQAAAFWRERIAEIRKGEQQ